MLKLMIKLLGKLEILYKWLFTNRPTSVALDVTHRCNLKCKHCYWWKQDHPKEMDDEAMILFMKNLKAAGGIDGEMNLAFMVKKTPGAIRIKGTEMFWNNPVGAEAILQIRAASLSDDDRLVRFLTHRPGQSTLRRRPLIHTAA